MVPDCWAPKNMEGPGALHLFFPFILFYLFFVNLCIPFQPLSIFFSFPYSFNNFVCLFFPFIIGCITCDVDVVVKG